MSDKDQVLTPAEQELRDGVFIYVSWRDSLGKPAIAGARVLPQPPNLHAYYQIDLYVRPPLRDSLNPLGSPDKPINNVRYYEYGNSKVSNGLRTATFLAKADWPIIGVYYATVTLKPDTFWEPGPELFAGQQIVFEAPAGQQVSDPNPQNFGATNAQCGIITEENGIVRGRAEFNAVARRPLR